MAKPRPRHWRKSSLMLKLARQCRRAYAEGREDRYNTLSHRLEVIMAYRVRERKVERTTK